MSASASNSDVESSGEVDVSQSLSQLSSLQQSITKLEKMLAPLLEMPIQNVTSQLSNLQSAKLQAALAYSASALYFISLPSSGESTAQHPIKKELERIKKYLKKVADAAEVTNNTTGNANSNANTSTTQSKSQKKSSGNKQRQQQQKGGNKMSVDMSDSESDSDASDDSDSEGDEEDEEVAQTNAAASTATAGSELHTPSKAQVARLSANKDDSGDGQSTTPVSSNKRGNDSQKQQSNKKKKMQKK